MGVSVEQWRRVIGCFLYKMCVEICTLMSICSASLRLCLLLANLLLMVGIESNPVLARNNVTVKLDQLSKDVMDVRNENSSLRDEFSTLNRYLFTRVDANVVSTDSLSARMLCTEQALGDLTTTVAKLSTCLGASATSTLPTLSIIDGTTPAAACSTASSSSNLTLPNYMCSLIAKLNLSSSKKCNIVLHGLPTGTGDEKSFVQNILDEKLYVKAMITSSLVLAKAVLAVHRQHLLLSPRRMMLDK